MKSLPPEVNPQYSRLARVWSEIPTLTHGVPGVFIGGLLVGVLLINNALHALWHALPLLIGLMILIPALYTIMAGVFRKDDYVASSGALLGSAGLGWVAIVLFCGWLSSCDPNKQVPPAPHLSCSKEGGMAKHWETDGAYSGHHVEHTLCNSGMTFSDEE